MRKRFVDRKVMRCAEHGKSAFCWVQDDGKHVDDSLCRCLTGSPARCPVDVHRRDAEPYLEFSNELKKGGKR